MRSILVVVGLSLVFSTGFFGGSTDVVDTSAIRGPDQATIVLNGRRNGCQPYEVARGSPSATVSNFMAASGCKSEAAVFAAMNAMSLVDTTGIWTNASGDTAYIPMQDPYVVPLNVYVMSGDFANGSIDTRTQDAMADVTEASRNWDQSQCGIAFAIKYIGDASHGNFGPDLLSAVCTDQVAAFRAVDTKNGVPSAINVYYNDGESGTLGLTCSDGNSAVIVISNLSTTDTLAHELGHALSLVHTDDNQAMPSNDLMNSWQTTGGLTVGQCFRANVNSTSVLHGLQIRPGASRQCPDGVPSTNTAPSPNDPCPALETQR